MAGDPLAIQYGRDIAVRLADYAAANALPANTVVWNGTWGGSFVDVGYTNGGVHLSTEVGRQPIEVDQELDAVALVATSRTTTMTTNLSQFDLDTVVDATSQGTVVNTPATTAARGQDEWKIGSTINDLGLTVGFDIKGRNGEPIRVLGRRGIPNAAMTLDFVKDSSTGVLIPLSVVLTPDPGNSNEILTVRTITPIAAA